jgi:hypothetical protein
MAQIITIENNMQATVNFSIVANGDIFIYGGNLCVKIDKNNPNYVVINTGVHGKLNDTDQVLMPNSVLLKVE